MEKIIISRKCFPAGGEGTNRRGGYIPTCDHGVPEEVSFENYLHFRHPAAEYA